IRVSVHVFPQLNVCKLGNVNRCKRSTLSLSIDKYIVPFTRPLMSSFLRALRRRVSFPNELIHEICGSKDLVQHEAQWTVETPIAVEVDRPGVIQQFAR